MAEGERIKRTIKRAKQEHRNMEVEISSRWVEIYLSFSENIKFPPRTMQEMQLSREKKETQE